MYRLKNILKNDLVVKYIVSYVLFMAIPIVIFSVIIFNYYIKLLHLEMESRNSSALERIKLIAENRFEQMHRMAYQSLLNQEIISSERDESVLADVKIIKTLESMHLRLDFIDNVYFYSQRKNCAYTSTRLYKFGEKNEPIFIYNNMDSIRLSSFLNSVSKNTMLHNVVVKENDLEKTVSVYLVLEGEKADAKMQRLMIFVIDSAKLYSIFNDEEVVILDSDNNIIISSVKEDALDELAPIIAQSSSSKNSAVKKTGKYYVSYTKTNYYGMQYFLFTNIDRALHNINRTKIIFIIGVLVILIVAFLIMPYVIKRQYAPIKTIKSVIIRKNPQNEYSNDLDMIKTALKDAYEQNEALDIKLKNQAHEITDYLLSKLIKGDYSSLADYNKKAAEYGISIKSDYLCVAFLITNGPSVMDCDSILRSQTPPVYHVSTPDPNRACLVIQSSSKKLDYKWVKSLYEKIEAKMGEKAFITIGNCYDSPSFMWRSYMEAKTIVDDSSTKKEGIVFFDEYTSELDIPDYSWNDKVDSLLSMVKTIQQDKVESIIDSIIDDVKARKYSIFSAKCVVYDIVNTIIKSLNSTGSVSNHGIEILSNFTALETVEDLREILSLICSDLMKNYRIAKANANSLIEDIVRKIEENFYKPYFSVQWLAEQFGMSISGISKYFKNTKGITIKEYVYILEMERAKELLLNTDLPIGEISLAIGQQDVSNFIKKFKRKMGITPGEFRELNSDS
ncbi:MAG: AraC family transcriptional regulator [Eubacteriales bacterium]|nr:AraC family transcriptional regulator [Eubacteriales bacterium]